MFLVFVLLHSRLVAVPDFRRACDLTLFIFGFPVESPAWGKKTLRELSFHDLIGSCLLSVITLLKSAFFSNVTDIYLTAVDAQQKVIALRCAVD
jgi:hypothetical protein